MSAIYLDALQIKVDEGITLLLADDTVAAPAAALQNISGLPSGWTGTVSSRKSDSERPQERPAIIFDPQLAGSGMHPLQIHELRTIYWDLEVARARGSVDDFVVSSSLQDSGRNRDWRAKQQKGSLHGTFSFFNYLGSAWLQVKRAGESAAAIPPLRFDVITAKLKYAEEYRAMVEAIGNECHQLLLEWNAPTTINISQDGYRNAQTLLEQFLFLRHVLGPDRLELYLEILHRQPHSQLVKERTWQPAGVSDSSLFVRDPLRFGRDWQRSPASTRGMVSDWNAAEILVERKYDSTDTPPNRFVKFALETFRAFCYEVIDCEFTEPGPPRRKRNLRREQGAAWQEAVQMRDALDSFLTSPFFDQVGRLSRVPFESQTLQKREGYREILHAFLMLDAAAQIDWPGRNDAYDGSNRDVATLYEFWLYFVLARAFKEDLGMVPGSDHLDKEVDGARPFCCTGDGGRMMIHLKRDEASFCRFSWATPEGSLRIHFFYNRPFDRRGVSVRGTYSKGFRPDYTLVIIPGDITEPDWEKAEQIAEQAGRIAYLHLDAKYRVDKLTAILGDGEEESGEERRTAKATGKFKNEDLYKMHTYNEAIRRTVGSYVLYPGDDPMNEVKKNRFQRYHEIVPGVGAFALRPSPDGLEAKPKGLNCFVGFLKELFTHQLSRFTQSYRISYWTEDTVKETPLREYGIDGKAHTIATPKAVVVLGAMPKGLAADFELRKYFYCRAIEQDGPVDIDIAAAAGGGLLGWTGPRGGDRISLPWIAAIETCWFLPKEELEDKIKRETSTDSPYYLYFTLNDIRPFNRLNLNKLVPPNSYKVRSCFWKDLVKQPVVDQQILSGEQQA